MPRLNVRSFFAVLLALFGIINAPGCHQNPQSRPMPVQRRPLDGQDPEAWRSYVRFVEPDSGEFVVRDILSGEGEQRWTLDHPELRFWVQPRPGMRFSMILWIAEATLRDTGPVTITLELNGHELGNIHCTHPGGYRFDQPVPIDWIHAREPVEVLAEADKVWISPSDGKHLAYLIQEAGFR
ncbi:MAG TPA: hypothetical protein VGV35_02040 [Bryobacteraceae bacterium]|nr:hypothetical protein [Bryobacteraceae bacterium]